MTAADVSGTRSVVYPAEHPAKGVRVRPPAGPAKRSRVNVGKTERWVSVASGAILTGLGLGRRSLPGLLIAGVGGSLLYRGATGHCAMYESLDIDTARGQTGRRKGLQAGVHVSQSFLINRTPEELYAAWRNFEKLPQIMTYLESVRVVDDKRSHWVVRSPWVLAGTKLEWDAEITRDEPNSRIEWRSAADADVENAGSVSFIPVPERGTMVRAVIDFLPPGGSIGKWAAKLFDATFERQVRDDLRNFKRIMETNEIPTIKGQPHGTCTGKGERSKE